MNFFANCWFISLLVQFFFSKIENFWESLLFKKSNLDLHLEKISFFQQEWKSSLMILFVHYWLKLFQFLKKLNGVYEKKLKNVFLWKKSILFGKIDFSKTKPNWNKDSLKSKILERTKRKNKEAKKTIKFFFLTNPPLKRVHWFGENFFRFLLWIYFMMKFGSLIHRSINLRILVRKKINFPFEFGFLRILEDLGTRRN